MKLQGSFCILAFLLFSVWAAQSNPTPVEEAQFEIGKSVHDLYSLRVALEQGDQMLPFLEPGISESFRSQLARDGQALFELRTHVTATADTMMQTLREPFGSFKESGGLKVRTAPRHRPFTEKLPAELTIDTHEGSVDIRKSGGTSVYHVSLDYVLPNGPCVSIKYRLPARGRRGGTPVPYFGVRDEAGEEKVILMFSTYPKPDEIHEILLFREADQFGAIHKGFMSTVRFKGNSDRAYAFFHLNDISRVVIEEVRLPNPQK